MAIGAGLGGLLADRIGRRQVFAVTLLVYGLATGAAALAGSVAALLVFRFVIGLGLGAELPVASTLVSEFAPARIRGRVVVVLEAFWAIGWLLAALIGYFVIPLSDDGWRWALALGAVAGAVRRRDPVRAAGVGRGSSSAEVAWPRRRPPCAGSRIRPGSAPPATLPARRASRSRSPGPAALWRAGTAAAHRRALAGVVLGQLLLLRRVHLAAHAARRVRAATWSGRSSSRW